MPSNTNSKIRMIKEIRNVTGLGLADAKAIADYLDAAWLPVHNLEVLKDPSAFHLAAESTLSASPPTTPKLSAATHGALTTFEVWKDEQAARGELEEIKNRLSVLERWVQAGGGL